MLLYESKIRTLPRSGQGKVRDIYAVGGDKMLIVTSDRLSAFDVVLSDPIPGQVRVRSMVVKKLQPLPIEAVVRGYIIGSGWKDYQKTGKVCGLELPKGLRQAEKLSEPIFTPATKAAAWHDENISFAEAEKLIGKALAA